MRASLLIPLALVAGCAAPTGLPSLAPRPAEALDPRVPVPVVADTRPVTPALAAELDALVAQARAGDRAFEAAAATAERLASAAGAPQSESWVVAQQALSAAVAARAPVTRAMGDIDALAARYVQASGGLRPADLAAIEAAAATVAAIDSSEAARIDGIQRRLGT